MKNMDEITTIQISVKTKEELSKIGKMSDTYDRVICRLIKEHYNLNIQPYLTQLKESLDFPANEEKKQILLQFFEEILSLGNDVSFKLQPDPKETPLIENEKRKNNVIFERNKKDLCFVRSVRGNILLYFPTKKQDTEFPGWKGGWIINNKYSLESKLEDLKRIYEDM